MNRTVFEIQKKSLTQIASKAIHAHILKGQKFIKKCQNSQFGE